VVKAEVVAGAVRPNNAYFDRLDLPLVSGDISTASATTATNIKRKERNGEEEERGKKKEEEEEEEEERGRT
jgi:hypothetical protein